MASIDPRVAAKVQPELASDETLQWAATPNSRVIFHSDDWVAIPFSLVWCAFWIYWEADALRSWEARRGHFWTFMVIWGIPFILIGQYLVWGRFLTDAWSKRRTYYALTNRRVLILQEAWKRKTRFVYLAIIPEIEREGTTTGTLWLGPKLPIIGGRASPKRDMSRFNLSQSGLS